MLSAELLSFIVGNLIIKNYGRQIETMSDR